MEKSPSEFAEKLESDLEIFANLLKAKDTTRAWFALQTLARRIHEFAVWTKENK